ncbi:MAG: hypothetical protein NZ821_08260 [Gloeomargarita sp. SKYB31]|nr:hypothetical protein [Gloeomargarita sp. SKYB31]
MLLIVAVLAACGHSVVAAEEPPPTPTPTPQVVVPQIDNSYFEPYAYTRGVASPLAGIHIDMRHVTRSIVTVFSFFPDFMVWIAAFAVLFIIISALLRAIIRRFEEET